MTMIYGGSKGFVPTNTTPLRDDTTGTVTDYGKRLGYKSDPLIYTGGAMGGENQNFMSPQASRTGQPVPASFELMGTAQKEQFTNQGGRQGNAVYGGGPIGTAPVGYRMAGDYVYPVYDPMGGLVKSEGLPSDYENIEYIPMGIGGNPGFVRQYGNWQNPRNAVDQKGESVGYLMAMLNGQNTGNMGPGSLGFAGMPTDRAGQLAALYKLDPAAWAQAMSSGAANPQDPNGQGSGASGARCPRDNSARRSRRPSIPDRSA